MERVEKTSLSVFTDVRQGPLAFRRNHTPAAKNEAVRSLRIRERRAEPLDLEDGLGRIGILAAPLFSEFAQEAFRRETRFVAEQFEQRIGALLSS